MKTTMLIFVGLQIVCALGQIKMKDDCPKVEVDPNANATECEPCLDCNVHAGNMCCPNKCGSNSCVFVRNHCVFGGKQYGHHDWVPSKQNYETDKCGTCWCQNGEKRCFEYNCKGPMP